MANRRIRKKQQKAAAGTNPADSQDQLLYIIEQVAAAHAFRDQLRSQGPGPATSGASHTPPPSGPRAAKRPAKSAPQPGDPPTLTPIRPGQGGTKKLSFVDNINKVFGKLGGPSSRGPAQSGIGKFHDNLSDLPITPLIIVIIVIALILLPVYQGYTRLDLLFMVLSGDASMPIPVRGAGQNYQQAQAAPPQQSNGTGGVGGSIWNQIIGGIFQGINPGIGGVIGQIGNLDTTTPATTTTLATPATGDSGPANDARAQQIAQQAIMPSPFQPGGAQTWLD